MQLTKPLVYLLCGVYNQKQKNAKSRFFRQKEEGNRSIVLFKNTEFI